MQNYEIMLNYQRDFGSLMYKEGRIRWRRVLMFPNKYGFMFYFCR